jgi:hypothetical protein
MLTELITSQYTYYSAIIIIGIYMTVDLPSSLRELYKNNLFKIIILSIVLVKSSNNIINSVFLSSMIIFITMNIFSKEKFQIDTTGGVFKLSGVRQNSTSGQSKVLTISQSSSDQSLSVSDSSSSSSRESR